MLHAIIGSPPFVCKYQINASDSDGSTEHNTLVFEIQPSFPVPFSVNQEGALVINEKLDYESGQSLFSFGILVHDNSTMTASDSDVICEGVELQVQESDQSPYFLMPSIHFP